MAKQGPKVHVNRKLVELDHAEGTVRDLLVAAGFAGDDWDVMLLQGEGDPSGGQRLDPTATIRFEPGQHIRVLPGNRNLGALA
jgi:hypothetical protein